MDNHTNKSQIPLKFKDVPVKITTKLSGRALDICQ